MKQANGVVKLSKEHDVGLVGLTPIEVMLLTAEHHRNVGGFVVEIDTTTEGETGYNQIVKVEKEVEEDIEVEVMKVQGQPPVKEMRKQKVKKIVDEVRFTPDNRTIDQECDRLRGKYGSAKVDVLLTKVRDMPTTFKDAAERGVKIVFPSGKFAEHKMQL